MNLVWWAADRPDEGEREANEAMARWAQAGFHRQHYNHALARIQTELYRRRGDEAWRIIDSNWSAMRRTFLFRIKFLRIEASFLRARAALLQAGAGVDTKRFLATAGRDAHRIEREGTGWANPLAWMVCAAIASIQTDMDRVRHELIRAIDGFDRAETPLCAAAARHRLGSLVAGTAGGELVLRSRAWMAAQQVVNPERVSAMLTPGFHPPNGGG